MTSRYESFGRMNQKRRTRAALMVAAADLVRRGETPTVAQAAEAALVSKSTAYRYFPSQDVLVAEVLLDAAIAPDLAAVYTAARTNGSAAARLDAVVRADHALVVKHGTAFRTALRAMLMPRADDPTDVPRRPGNRLRYLAEALAPLRDQLGAASLQRLVMALAMCVGPEGILVLEDTCSLSAADAEAVKRWAATALLRATLDEAAAAEGGMGHEGSISFEENAAETK